MANFLKFAILRKGSENFCVGSTALPTGLFNTEEFATPPFVGWLIPWMDNGLGKPDDADSIIQSVSAPSPTAIPGIYFEYKHSTTYTERYFVSATSTQLATALVSTNPNAYTAMTPIAPFTAEF